MKSLNEISAIAKSENHGRKYFVPLLSFNIILVLSTVCSLIVSNYCLPVNSFAWTRDILGLGSALALTVLLALLRRYREDGTTTAVELDKIHGSQNRMEAALELVDGNSILRDAQLEQCTSFYKKLNFRNWFGWVGLLCFLIPALMTFNGVVGIYKYNQTIIAVEEEKVKEELAAKEKEEEDVPSDEFAELALTAPKSEMRAKPMDEVAWDGIGRSSNPFDDMFVSIYINGTHNSDIDVDGLKRSDDGEILMSGEFYLDELNVEPFDVVSYHLMGHTELNGNKMKQVISIPHYIEVRPFREDVGIMRGMPAEEKEKMKKKRKLLGLLNKILRFQLTLNKATFAARASGLTIDNPVFGEQVELLGDEQNQLKLEVENLFVEFSAEEMPPNVMDCMRQAEEYMANASKSLLEFGAIDKKQNVVVDSQQGDKGVEQL